MKRILILPILLVYITSIENISINPVSLAQSANEGKREAPTATVYSAIPEANALFLKAREYRSRANPRTGGTLANAREAIKLYEQAVKKDPQFALAYAEMARTWQGLSYSVPGNLKPKENYPKAKAAALKAVQLNNKMPEAHLALATVYINFDYDWAKAEREYKIALQLAPSDPAAHTSYATFLGMMGRLPEALAGATRAEELMPSFDTAFYLARTHYWMRDYDKAVEYYRKALARGKYSTTHQSLGHTYAAMGRFDEAIAEIQKGLAIDPNGGLKLSLAYAYAAAGRGGEAVKLVAEVKKLEGGKLIVPYRMAAVYLALGDKDEALKWLRVEYERRGGWMNNLKVDPVMDSLRSDPRFQELMRKMSFKE